MCRDPGQGLVGVGAVVATVGSEDFSLKSLDLHGDEAPPEKGLKNTPSVCASSKRAVVASARANLADRIDDLGAPVRRLKPRWLIAVALGAA